MQIPHKLPCIIPILSQAVWQRRHKITTCQEVQEPKYRKHISTLQKSTESTIDCPILVQTLICLQLCQVSGQLHHMLATKTNFLLHRNHDVYFRWQLIWMDFTLHFDIWSRTPWLSKYFYWLFKLPERGGKQGGSNIVQPSRERSARQQGEALLKSWRTGKPTTGKWTSHTDHCLEWLKYWLQEQWNFYQTVLRQHDLDLRKLQLLHLSM